MTDFTEVDVPVLPKREPQLLNTGMEDEQALMQSRNDWLKFNNLNTFPFCPRWVKAEGSALPRKMTFEMFVT